MMTAFQDMDVRLSKKTMYVLTQGNYANTPIVFIHAIPFSSNMWHHQMKHFSKKYYTLAPDLPGFGKGELSFNAVTSEFYVEYLANVIKASGFKKTIWCGISFGGYLAIRLYELIPDLCDGLILANTFAGTDDNETKKRRWNAIKKIHSYRDEFLHKQWDVYTGNSSKENLELKHQIIRMMDQNSNVGMSAAFASLSGRVDCSENLKQISVPTLIIYGDEDNVVSREKINYMHEHIPHSELEIIQGAGHLSCLEKPDEFNFAIERFLNEKSIRQDNELEHKKSHS